MNLNPRRLALAIHDAWVAFRTWGAHPLYPGRAKYALRRARILGGVSLPRLLDDRPAVNAALWIAYTAAVLVIGWTL